MLMRRLIVCLDVLAGRVVKGVNFEGLREIGDPVELAAQYEKDGADEIVYLDISASAEDRSTLLDTVRRTAEQLFIPLTVGGGVSSAEGVGRALRAGADKVSLNTAAVERPAVLTEAAERFGSQCIVASIDAAHDGAAWRVYVKGGRQATGVDAIEWAQECVARGAGEIMLTSIDRDGARTGYDLPLTAAIAQSVTVPVIASGGAGSSAHVCDAFIRGEADAALVAGILHDGVTTVRDLKNAMETAGLPVRRTW